jgi:hypothetical protein
MKKVFVIMASSMTSAGVGACRRRRGAIAGTQRNGQVTGFDTR